MSIRVHAVRSLLIGAAALAVATPAWAQTTEEQQAQATNEATEDALENQADATREAGEEAADATRDGMDADGNSAN